MTRPQNMATTFETDRTMLLIAMLRSDGERLSKFLSAVAAALMTGHATVEGGEVLASFGVRIVPDEAGASEAQEQGEQA